MTYLIGFIIWTFIGTLACFYKEKNVSWELLFLMIIVGMSIGPIAWVCRAVDNFFGIRFADTHSR